MVKVSVVGAKGRMGSHVVAAVNGADDMELALTLDAGDDLTRIDRSNTDVVVEFTVPSVSLAWPACTITFWPPRAYSPSGMPAASMASVMATARSGPLQRAMRRTISRCRCTPSQIISQYSRSSVMAAPGTPGFR